MKKILVIEDNNSIREEICTILGYEGFEVIDAGNGIKGIESAKTSFPDLILCDILMPGLNGYDVFKELQGSTETATIPFIFLTAKASKEEIRNGMKLGADDYITKPFVPEEIISAVNTRLEKYGIIDKRNQNKIDTLTQNINYTLPHELNTPLTSIIGCSELIIDFAKESQIQELAETILSSSKRLEILVKKFLIYSQIEILKSDQKRLSILKEIYTDEPKPIIQSICLQQAEESKRKSDLSLKITNNRIKISEDNFSEIIYEIINNAFKFSEKGNKIEVSASVTNNYYVIQITDYGRGMTGEQISNIGTYMQFDRKIYEQQGMGLGLIIAKKLTELHEGDFEIISKLGESTIVTIKLKRHD